MKLELFHCTKLNCKLTSVSCGRRYAKTECAGSHRTESVLPYIVCTGCPIGAKNVALVPADERGLISKKNAPGAPNIRGKLRRFTGQQA